MNRVLLIVLFALLGLAAGFGLRAWRQSHPSAGDMADHAAPLSAVAPGTPPKLAHARASELVEQLQADLSLSHGVTRWLHWMTAVEKAGVSDFPHLARLAKELPGGLNMLAALWIERDPQSLFAACRQGGEGFPANELAQLLFQTWPKDDPDAVLAALQEHRNLADGWQLTALNTLFQNRPEQALIAMHRLGIDSYGPNMDDIAKWAEADPRHAAEVALAHPAGHATEMVLEAIAKEWTKSDPAAALAFATSLPDGTGGALANQVLRHWVEKDLGRASEWFATVEERTREKLLPAFVEAWGKTDPALALQWCLAHTAGALQGDVVQSLVKGALERNPATAAALVAGMEASSLRTKAAVAFAREAVNKGWFPRFISQGQQPQAKPEAKAWLEQLDPEARKEVLKQVSWSWSSSAPRDFAAFLQSEAGRDAPPEVLAAAAHGLVRENPSEALEWAGHVPEALRRDTLSSTFQQWTRAQPDAAMTWLRQLPADDARRETFYLGAVKHAIPSAAFQNGPITSLDPIDQARQHLAHLLATDPAAARRTLATLSLSEEARAAAIKRLLPVSTGK